MDKPLEIEYKYLIRYPDIEILKVQSNYQIANMCQMYLELPEGVSEHGKRCRIRCSETEPGTLYTKTFKTKLTDMTRIEVESEISKEEFESLSQYIREGYSPIKKQRHSFSMNGFIYEVDVFPFWQDRAFLEIEVESEDVQPPIPDFITIIKDVTSDDRYRNSALAQKIITEDI